MVERSFPFLWQVCLRTQEELLLHPIFDMYVFGPWVKARVIIAGYFRFN